MGMIEESQKWLVERGVMGASTPAYLILREDGSLDWTASPRAATVFDYPAVHEACRKCSDSARAARAALEAGDKLAPAYPGHERDIFTPITLPVALSR